MPFPNTWNNLQRNLVAGAVISNWTVDKGPLGDSFSVAAVAPTYIEVDTPGAQNLQRVPITDFRLVYNLWEGYRQGRLPRRDIRDSTRFSKYIISIFHWLEAQTRAGLL